MYNYKSVCKKIIVDTITPVSIYLKLRDQFSNTILLESSDYIAKDNSYAYICCNPISKFYIKKDILTIEYPDKVVEKKKLNEDSNVFSELSNYMSKFNVKEKYEKKGKFQKKIDVEIQLINDYINIVVEDNGTGFTNNDLKTLSKP